MFNYPSASFLSCKKPELSKNPQTIQLNSHLTKYLFSDGSVLFINSTTGKADAFPNKSDWEHFHCCPLRDIVFSNNDYKSEMKRYDNI